jgi:dTDP-4-dehydrorhamnose reductase
MRIAVLGSQGQLGRDLVPRLPGDVVALTRADLDLGNPDTIAPTIAKHRPGIVVNCAAYNFVDRAEDEPEAAFRVNAWGLRELARACAAENIRLVHFSTDYVFGLDAGRSGTAGGRPWLEGDAPGPVSVYGLSKLAGEYLVRSTCPNHLVIRTCGLYGVWGSGGKGGNFIETMLRIAGQGKPLKVVDDQRCTPTYTADLAERSVEWISGGKTGLVHMTSSGECTWFELAREAIRLAGLETSISPITTAEFGAKARRPAYSVLASERDRPLRHWREALAAYVLERQKRPANTP